MLQLQLLTQLPRLKLLHQLGKLGIALATLLKMIVHLDKVLDVGGVELEEGPLVHNHVGNLLICVPVLDPLLEVVQQDAVEDEQVTQVAEYPFELLARNDGVGGFFAGRCVENVENELAEIDLNQIQHPDKGTL